MIPLGNNGRRKNRGRRGKENGGRGRGVVKKLYTHEEVQRIRKDYEDKMESIKKGRTKKRESSEKKHKNAINKLRREHKKELAKMESEYLARKLEEVRCYRKELEAKDKLEKAYIKRIKELETENQNLHIRRKNLKKNLEEQIERK